jgi:hypothetical protein
MGLCPAAASLEARLPEPSVLAIVAVGRVEASEHANEEADGFLSHSSYDIVLLGKYRKEKTGIGI